jgi:putative ABC transport system permease protein
MRDMGVRIALGADARRLITRVLGQGLRLAAIGAAIGLLGALAASRVVQGLDVFGLGTRIPAPGLLLAVAVVMMTVAGLAACRPALRASRVDPRIVLRHD